MIGLKGFHIAFIVLSVLLSFYVAWLSFSRYSANTPDLAGVGAISLVLGAALLVYGVWFLKKIKRMGL